MLNRRELAIFVALYLYMVNMSTANDMRRVIILASLIQIHALRAQLLILNQRRIQRRRRAGRLRRRFWVLPRPVQSWFDIHFVDIAIPDDYFRRQLRLNRTTFTMLLNTLRPRLTRQNTSFRDCIAPEKILAIGLYRLAHGNAYVTIGPNFNVGKTTVIEAVEDVVEALCDLKEEYIKFPSTNREVLATCQTFEELTDLPNVVGAIDGTHIKIKTPIESGPDYFSRLQQHDVVVQAVVDGEKRFLDVAAGFPGSMHDSRVLRNSALYRRINNNELLTGPTVRVGGREIKPVLLGDSAYPLSTWLLKPYPESTNDPPEINFNKELSSGRVSVECAYGILKGRWRILQKRLDSNIAFTSQIIIACCILHNFCIEAGDLWDDDGVDNDNDFPIRDGHRDGENLRNFLKEHLWNL